MYFHVHSIFCVLWFPNDLFHWFVCNSNVNICNTICEDSWTDIQIGNMKWAKPYIWIYMVIYILCWNYWVIINVLLMWEWGTWLLCWWIVTVDNWPYVSSYFVLFDLFLSSLAERVIQLLAFWPLSIILFFYLKTVFRRLDSVFALR
jgi:hypothetical protein